MADLKVSEITSNDEIGRIINEEIASSFSKKYVLVGEEKTCMPEHYLKYVDSIKHFEVQPNDVIVASYPKCGTTWAQEMVWLIANNLDYKGAQIPLTARFPYFEFCIIYDWDEMDKVVPFPNFAHSIEFVKQQQSPRFIKTHLPFCLLPEEVQNGSKTPKIIYVMRNPKDSCVSFYYHTKLFQRLTIALENYAKVFLADKVVYGPFWKHVFGYWKHRSSPNLLLIQYEDMKKDLPSVIKRVADFLNKKVTEQQTEKLAQHLSFESMKKNPAVNRKEAIELRKRHNLIDEDGEFIRTGAVGKYKEEMSPVTIEAFDAWIKKNIDGTEFGLQCTW